MTATEYPHSLDDAAQRLDAPRETVDVYAGQISDDPALFDSDTSRLSEAGLQVLADQIASVHREPLRTRLAHINQSDGSRFYDTIEITDRDGEYIDSVRVESSEEQEPYFAALAEAGYSAITEIEGP